MQYCYFCSEPINKPSKVCPHCKGTLDLTLYESLLEERETSHLSTKNTRRIWFIEHAHIFWPVITLIAGVLLGSVLTYGFAQLRFADTKAGLLAEIDQLKVTIEQHENTSSSAQAQLADQLEAKANLITILDEQKEILSRIINFTRRFSESSVITPNSDDVADTFKRNFNYLNNQFFTQQELLKQKEHSNISTYNLQTVPQILSD